MNFLRWLNEGNTPNLEPASVQDIPEVKAVEEKVQERIVITSKKVSDDIREIGRPESILSDLRSMNSYARVDGPTSEDILRELKKISEQITKTNLNP